MLIAVISDIHDNLANLKKFLDWSRDEKIEKIFCCGDVTDLTTVKYLSANFNGEIFLISSTRELFPANKLAKYKNIRYCGEVGLVDVNGIKVGFCHEPRQIQDIKKKYPDKPDFIFYGHTHKPWIEKQNDSYIVNPGNIAGIYYQATFAILNSNNKKIELKILTTL